MANSAIILRATGSHLYPGARGTVSRDGPGACLIEFADGSAAVGTLGADASGGRVLDVAGYRTARGTDVPPRRWRLDPGAAPGAFRIAARG